MIDSCPPPCRILCCEGRWTELATDADRARVAQKLEFPAKDAPPTANQKASALLGRMVQKSRETPRNKRTDVTREKCREMRARGMRMKDIAAELHISRYAVRLRLNGGVK